MTLKDVSFFLTSINVFSLQLWHYNLTILHQHISQTNKDKKMRQWMWNINENSSVNVLRYKVKSKMTVKMKLKWKFEIIKIWYEENESVRAYN